MTWRTIDGYHTEMQLVDGDGRIVGTVYGTRFESHKGWRATILPSGGESKPLGQYVTKEQAMSAVERAVKNAKWS